MDWSLALSLAEHERATSVLWKTVLRGSEEDLPPHVVEVTQRLSMLADFASFVLEDRCRTLVRAASDRGIDVVLLKGAALALSVYDGFVDRPMGDLDILVAPDQATAAWELAREIGWQWQEAEYPAQRYAAHHHLPPLLDGAGGGARLELHAALGLGGHPFSLSYEQVLRRSVRLESPLGRVALLDREHQIVHVCVHFAWAHLMVFGAWRAVRDLNALVASGPMDWDRVIQVSREQHAGSSVYWALRLAHELTGVPVAADVLRELSRSSPNVMRETTLRHLVAQMFPLGETCPSERFRRAMWSLALAPERQGIGRERPWDWDEVALGQQASHASAASKVARQVGSVRAWWRYLRVVAGPG